MPTWLTDSELREIESLLGDLGFDPGPIDGVMDEATFSAIKRYQDFASLPGDPDPNQALLRELRGVAAAFAALRNDATPATATAVPVQDSGATAGEEAKAAAPRIAEPDATEPEVAETEAPELKTAEMERPETENAAADPSASATARAESDGPEPSGKIIVPPPPAPQKLTPLEATAEIAPAPGQIASRPTGENLDPGAREEAEGAEARSETAVPTDSRQALIDAELAPYRSDLADGSLKPEDLAKQFNIQGRQFLQAADYDDAIRKFHVAIYLNPRFAGAYSNRGTAYERQGQRGLAVKDFDRARQLGFGGVRPSAQDNPLR